VAAGVALVSLGSGARGGVFKLLWQQAASRSATTRRLNPTLTPRRVVAIGAYE